MTDQKVRRPYGLWDSPITPISLARGIGFADVGWDHDGSLVWLENRSDRGVLVVQPPDGQAPRDLNSEYSIRARVGYGGGDFTAGHGHVYFADAASGRIYRQPTRAGSPAPVTPAFGQAAAPKLSPDGRWLLFIHTCEGQDVLAVVDAEGKLWPQKLTSGEDFYMQPAWHPDGEQIAFVSWSFPNMPWDGTRLNLGRLVFAPGGLPSLQSVQVVSGDEDTAIFQPEFSPDGRYLAYISDASGWGQLYLHDLETGETRQLTHVPAEHATPGWVQGLRCYAFSADSQRLFVLRSQEGVARLWQIAVDTGEEQRLPLDEGYTSLEQIAVLPVAEVEDTLALLASGGTRPPRVITYQPSHLDRVWRRAQTEELAESSYAAPQSIRWTGMDGGTVYGLYYPPHNPRFEGSGKPPLIVHVHGGPTGQACNAFTSQAQYFASRGYAYLSVNYRGSTGYGRQYMNALRGSWGIYDVQDAVSGARALSASGLVDGTRRVIIGGSAGGFTVLKALEDFPGEFKAGICLYGISNQFTLAAETHKFEAHYSDRLLGPLPEAAEIYRERSPIFFVDRIKDPIAVFQGEIDQVVPRKQADEVVESLRRSGVPHIYQVYPGEGHGFRKAENIEHFYKTVEQFLRQYVIFA